MTVSTRPATTAMGFFVTLMTPRPALKLGLLRARKRREWKNTTKDEALKEEKCNHKHILVGKHA